MTAGGIFPRKVMRRGEKDMRHSKIEAGIRVKREALLVAAITPGLKEKLTGPTIPRNPAMILERPVKVIPRFVRDCIVVGLSISFIDWIDPRSFMESAKKQNKKEVRTPGSNDKLVVKP